MTQGRQHFEIAIIGAGFSGLGLAVHLKARGIHDFVILERRDGVGGTWRDNSYPGCACDIESHLYSYSFAPNPSWSQIWAPQPEILQYLNQVVIDFDLQSSLRPGVELFSAVWNEEQNVWNLRTSRGEFSCRFLVSAMGALSEPLIPEIPGKNTFQGEMFHSAKWNHEIELTGKKVAVIGTGASAIQFVPAIQPKLKSLYLFQRTPAWVVATNNRKISAGIKKLFKSCPWLGKMLRLWLFVFHEIEGVGFRYPRWMWLMEFLARRNLTKNIQDPELQKKLIPRYRIGCKRILLSNQYYPAIRQENVELITDEIDSIVPQGIQIKSGRVIALDAIIWGTGFDLSKIHCMAGIVGSSGKTLKDTWGNSPKAYKGTMVPGFPNLFLLLGPSTGLGHNSILLMIEAQYQQILSAIEYVQKRRGAKIEPKLSALADYSEKLEDKLKGTVWNTGCKSWYLDPTGRNSTLWPGSVRSFRKIVSRFEAEEYVLSS